MWAAVKQKGNRDALHCCPAQLVLKATHCIHVPKMGYGPQVQAAGSSRLAQAESHVGSLGHPGRSWSKIPAGTGEVPGPWETGTTYI